MARSSQTRPLPLSLRRLWIRSMGAFLLMFVLAHLESLVGNPGERFVPLVDPAFGDLLEYQSTFRYLHTAAFFSDPDAPHVAYPPFGAVLFVPLYQTRHPVATYLLIASMLLGLAHWRIRRGLLDHGISARVATLFPLCLMAASFPIAGLLQRGNIELFVLTLSWVGCWSYWRMGRYDDIAAICWGLAGAIKLYPILFLVLLLSRGRYRALMLGIGAFLASSLLSMIYLGPSLAVAWAGSAINVLGYQGARFRSGRCMT